MKSQPKQTRFSETHTHTVTQCSYHTLLVLQRLDRIKLYKNGIRLFLILLSIYRLTFKHIYIHLHSHHISYQGPSRDRYTHRQNAQKTRNYRTKERQILRKKSRRQTNLPQSTLSLVFYPNSPNLFTISKADNDYILNRIRI